MTVSTILLLPHPQHRAALLAPGVHMLDKVLRVFGWTVPGGWIDDDAVPPRRLPVDADSCLVLALPDRWLCDRRFPVTDYIIAVVPAPGHEYLTADGPMGERPAILYAAIQGGWYPPGRLNEHRIPDGRRALVLHAPRGPKLGMVRAMDAAGLRDAAWRIRSFDGAGCSFDERVNLTDDGWYSDIRAHRFPASPDTSIPGVRAWGLAHLLVLRGIASEVVVLPVEVP